MVFLASDNTAPVAKEIMQALQEANVGHAKTYGADVFSDELTLALRSLFEHDTLEAFPVFGGSASNCSAFAALMKPYEAVIAHQASHIENDECGMPEFFTGGKVLTVGGENGKLDLAAVRSLLSKTSASGVHHARPRLISCANLTERGTAYSSSELKALSALAKANGLFLHVDGARFANVVAASGQTPAQLTWQAGVDVLSFGATKNGAMIAEAVIFFRPELASDFGFVRKRSGQLASKQRYISAQILAYLKNGLWLRLAQHANEMAKKLEAGLKKIPQADRVLFPVEGNILFVAWPDALANLLLDRGHYFYGGGGTCRLVTSFYTTPEEIDVFLVDVREIAASLS